MQAQRGFGGGIELHGLRGVGGNRDGLLKSSIAEAPAQLAADGGTREIRERGLQRNLRRRSIGRNRNRVGLRIFDAHGAGRTQKHIAPDAGVAAADGGNPVPADRSVHGGIIRAQHAAVLAGTLKIFFRDAAGVGILENAHRQRVRLTRAQQRGDVETAGDESAVDAAQPLAVEEHFRFPVDAIEIEKDVAAGRRRRSGEFGAVPEIGIEERVRDGILVVTIIGIGDGAVVEVTGKHGGGDGGDHPIGVAESGGRERGTRGMDLRSTLETPGAARKRQAAIGGGRCGRFGVQHGTALAPHFELAQNVWLVGLRLGQHHAHPAGMRGAGEANVVDGAGGGGQGLQSVPFAAVIGDLDGSFGGAADPVERDAIEAARRAQIHRHPLIARGGAHPGTREFVRAAGMHGRLGMAEREFGNPPVERAPGFEIDAIETAAAGLLKSDGGLDLDAGMRHAPRAAQFGPRLPIRRPRENARPLLVVAARNHRGQPLQPVDFRRRRATPFHLDPDMAAGHVDAGGPIAVKQQLALILRQHSLVAGGDAEKTRRRGFPDAVGDQLRGEVVVVTAGLIGRPVERQVAIGGRIDFDRRRPILPRISGIHADAARVGLRAQSFECHKGGENLQRECHATLIVLEIAVGEAIGSCRLSRTGSDAPQKRQATKTDGPSYFVSPPVRRAREMCQTQPGTAEKS